MKSVLKILLLSCCIAAGLWSCKKDETKFYFEGGTAPVLTSSATGPLILTAANKNNEALKLSWTDPAYKFSSGASTRIVSYTIQVDTTGSNFTNPAKQEVTVNKDLSRSITVGDLNNYLTKMLLKAETVHNIEFRVVSNLGGTVPLNSNVIKLAVTPYEDYAIPPPVTDQLYITGDATPSDWTNNPPASQKLTKRSNGVYDITINFVPGKFYKFLSKLTEWQPQYGVGASGNASGGDIGINLGPGGSDPGNIPTPAAAGSYKVEVNFKTGKYTVTKQ